MSMANNICVAVRKRPAKDGEKDIVEAQTATNKIIVNEPKVKYDMSKYTERHNFVFDQALDEKVTNREVYVRCAQPLIETVFSRGNATCFAYGQTGSGKTHTMLGKQGEPGLYACAAHDVFQRASAGGMSVYAAFYEIYGRKMFDLLNDKAPVVAREDGNAQIIICGLTEHPVNSVEELLRMIASGSEGRAAGQTSANNESSRSHAVLQLEVRENPTQKTVGRISFIDLAGNERGSDTFNCDRKTRMEGAEINKSLLALKECIRSLGMGKNHVPFRGSILTEVLRDSFLGNSRTTMIATINATSTNCEHTLNTLRYTQRVKDLGKPEVPVVRERIPDPKPQPRRAGGGVVPAKASPSGDFAAMAARIGADAAGGAGAASPAAFAPEPVLSAPPAPPSNPAPRPKQIKPSAPRKVERPQWIDDFAGVPESGDSDVEAGGRRSPEADPAVEKIIEDHLDELDEVDKADEEDDDEEEADPMPAVAPSAKGKFLGSAKKAKAIHAHIVERIRQMEEKIIVRHRAHVDQKNRLTKEEVVAIQQLDATDDIDTYVSRVDQLLSKQEKQIKAMRDELAAVNKMLREEEVLSKSLTPQAGAAAAAAARRQR